jgi:hypothetical protein
MFEQILNVVKEQIGNNPNAAAAIPADKADDVHKEIASQITNGLKGRRRRTISFFKRHDGFW